MRARARAQLVARHRSRNRRHHRRRRCRRRRHRRCRCRRRRRSRRRRRRRGCRYNAAGSITSKKTSAVRRGEAAAVEVRKRQEPRCGAKSRGGALAFGRTSVQWRRRRV